MSKSKLNRRQLKKISKIARDSLALQKWANENEEEFVFVRWLGEYASLEPIQTKYGYRPLGCIELLELLFVDVAPFDCDFDVLRHRASSFANKVHRMIKYLENNNEN